MTLKNIIKDTNDILGLPIDWNNTATDENYQQLFRCACLVLDNITGEYEFTDDYQISENNVAISTIIYGILTEYSFVAGMLNEWKIWRQKFADGLFAACKDETKVMPRGF
ncbi:MAG: hypothetical protein LBQ05_01000 [Christensenellaceae bacterium]|jgi:hypothetical protein|nr:hypothetical protein [Christensenellaceae bacterium]